MDTAALLTQRLTERTWVAFDTEATGYSNVTARLVEVAGVKFRFLDRAEASERRIAPAPAVERHDSPEASGGEPEGAADEPPAAGAPGPRAPIEILDEFAELVNPGVPIPDEVIQIHGISNAIVRNLPGPGPVLERFFAFCGDSVLVAHYAPFDLGAMTYALLREGRRVPRLVAIDTSTMPRRLFPGAPNYALETLVSFLGLPPAAAHRAMPDALSTMELFRRCVAAMGEAQELTLGEVCRRAGPPLSFDQWVEIPPAVPPELRAIDDAIAAHHDLTLEYRGGSKGNVPRRVTPSHLFARDGALFLEGWCHLDQAAKSFRVDRIGRVSVLPVAPDAPLLVNKGSGHWVKEERSAH